MARAITPDYAPAFFSATQIDRGGSRSNLGLLLLRFPALHTNTHIRVIQFGCPAPKTGNAGGGLLRPPFLSPFPFVTERGATVTAAQLLLCGVGFATVTVAWGEFAHGNEEKFICATNYIYLLRHTRTHVVISRRRPLGAIRSPYITYARS